MPKKVPVSLVITGVDRVSKVMARITNKFPKLSKQISRTATMFKLLQQKTERFRKTLSRVGSKMRSVGQTMTTRLSAPIGLAGAAVVNTAVKFQKSMNRVGALTRTIVGGVISPEFEKLEERARELGATTEFSSQQVADAMAVMGQQGLKTGEILEATDDILALASATGVELTEAIDIAGKTMKQFGLEANEMTRISDVLALTTASTNTSMETIGETFKAAAPVAKAYGATLEQTAALTGLLGDAGIQGSLAGTTLKNVFIKLAKPSGRAAEILKRLNVQVTDGKNGMKDVGKVLSELAPKLAKLPKNAQLDVINELFGLRGIAGASALMSNALAKGKDPVAALTKTLQGATGTAKDMQATMLRGAPGALARMQSAFEGLGLAIADSGLLDFFTEIVEGLGKFFSKLSKVSPAILKFGTIIAGLIVIIGPIIGLLGFMVSGIGSLITAFSAVSAVIAGAGGVLALLTGPIGLVIAGIAALIAIGVLLVKNWEAVKQFFTMLWDGPLGSFIKFFTPVGMLINLAGAIMEAWEPITGFFSGIFDSIFGLAKKFFSFVMPKLAKIADFVLFGKGKKFFSEGESRAKGELGPAKGAAEQQKEVQAVRSEQVQRGVIDVNFGNVPKGTRVRSEGPALNSLNLGMSGAPG